ncbi:hypothetical protein P168DRAFT_287799 [Aspergillus campestris IBT 28561]|uniref:GATA-domain-containing protein n=1 Tax=Aspergillus campestris (strain IBT 28561) TaxID=1392248 RepID=A0A2I1DBQ1_ASPC2|nr:uncharacterized protein P168DRAFT_287799 [Aspergillus campestris IBT 28561]PKY07305.1 hypothetical protein P168DRAFT_287799 [Aspergillus campestris IBT 28561]
MELMPRDWDRGTTTIHSPTQSQQQQQQQQQHHPSPARMYSDTHPSGVPHAGGHGSYGMAGNVSMPESLTLPPSPSPAASPAAANHSAQDPPWSQRVLDDMSDMLLLLTRDGRVLYASSSSIDVAGCEPSRLQGSPLSLFIHDDDREMFARELQQCIAESRPFHCYFRFHRADNKPCVVEGCGHPHLSHPVDSRSQPETCNGVFLICRPYPTRSTQLLDAFLEHKIENIRLHQRVAQLKQEEEEDLRAAQQQQQQQLWSSGNDTSSSPHSQPSTQLPAPQPHPRRRSLRNSGREATGSNSNEDAESSDTQGSADDDSDSDQRTLLSQAAARKEHAENMAHIDGVEVMTGLYYRNGEWSQGLSTGLHSGRLLQDDLDPDRRKRSKGEYMCTDCGTSDSPEWRRGPEGPKTLCNACGCMFLLSFFPSFLLSFFPSFLLSFFPSFLLRSFLYHSFLLPTFVPRTLANQNNHSTLGKKGKETTRQLTPPIYTL